MVGPRGFEAVSKLFYRLDARAIPHQETYECCCQTAYHPDQVLHACPFVSAIDDSYQRREGLDAGDVDWV
jgi:hypothetical protein